MPASNGERRGDEKQKGREIRGRASPRFLPVLRPKLSFHRLHLKLRCGDMARNTELCTFFLFLKVRIT